MDVAFFQSLGGALPGAIFGAFIGYYSAVKKIPSASRPKIGRPLIIGVIGGAFFTLIFEVAMLNAFSNANVDSMVAGVSTVFGIGVALTFTNKEIKKNTKASGFEKPRTARHAKPH